MNDFFDKLGAAARRAAGNVANEVSVAAEKQKLSDLYRNLGKLYYQAVKSGEAAELSTEIAKIDEALKRLEELKDRRNVEPDVTAEESDFVIVEE